MAILMVSPRDYTLRTLHGHVIGFEAGVPTPVAEAAVAEALAVNIVPATKIDMELEAAGGAVRSGSLAMNATLRDAVIFSVIDDMVKENDPENFNAGGQPKHAALRAATGLPLTGAEVAKYWDRYREIIGSNSPLPYHPRAESVMELQRLTTRKQLIEFAADIDVPASEVTKRSLRQAKEFLMSATIAYMEAATASDDDPPPVDTRTLAED